MVQRKSAPRIPCPSVKDLSKLFNKGFNFDVGNNIVEAHYPSWRKKEPVSHI